MPTTNTYRAWTFRPSGDRYELHCESRDAWSLESLSETEVVVRVRAVSLNYRDIIAWKNLAGRNVQGRVPASDGAGEVVAVGTKVSQWKIGDRVAGCFFPRWQSEPFDLQHHKHDLGGNLDGMLQQYTCFDETGLVRIPESYSFVEGATLPCAALTAWYALVERGGLKAGDTVLALGTGGVSIFALQIAQAAGAKVIVTSGDNAKCQRALELGALHTVNYRETPNWADEVWKKTDGHGVQHVVEVGGPGTLEQSMRAVAASGHIALIGVLTGFGPPTASLFPLLARNIRLNGIYVGPRDAFQRMNAFLEKHSITPVIDREFAFAEAPAAFAYLESGQHFGKVAIRVE